MNCPKVQKMVFDEVYFPDSLDENPTVSNGKRRSRHETGKWADREAAV